MVTYNFLIEKNKEYNSQLITLEKDYNPNKAFIWKCSCGITTATVYRVFVLYHGKCSKCRNINKPKKIIQKIYTYEYVKKIFEDVGCELLSSEDEYKGGTKVKVNWKCKCGNIDITTVEYFKNYLKCRICKRDEKSNRFTYEDFCKLLESEGWKMLSPKSEYGNTKSILTVQTNLGKIVKKSYNNFQQGHRSKEETDDNKRNSYEQVKHSFEEKGFILLDEKYINNNTLMKYKCKCGDISQITYSNLQKNIDGCLECSKQKKKEKFDENWKENGRENLNRLCISQTKNYILPSGKICMIQGYENFCLDDLIYNENIKEDDLLVGIKDIYCFSFYSENEKEKFYYPDIFIKSLNKFIEVKSKLTINIKNKENQLKWESVARNGYEIEIRIYDLYHLIEKRIYKPYNTNPTIEYYDKKSTSTHKKNKNIIPQKRIMVEKNDYSKIDIEDYPGYIITSNGDVISSFGNTIIPKYTSNSAKVRLTKDKKQHTENVDELVLKHFLPEEHIPKLNDHRYTIAHLDGDIKNNNINNLAVVENLKITNQTFFKDTVGLPILQYTTSMEFIKEYSDSKHASLDSGVSAEIIKRACNGGRNKIPNEGGGFIWKYKNKEEENINLSENWKIIDVYTNYKISENGIVWDISKNKQVNPFINEGSLKVNLKKDGMIHKEMIHNLVARTYLKNPQNSKFIVIHKNGDKKDNRVENLKWSPQGLSLRRPVAKCDDNFNIIQIFDSVKDAAADVKVSETLIRKVCNKVKGKKSAGTYKWKWVNE